MADLNTAVIYGSVRSARKGINAAKFVVRKLQERDHDVTLVDAADGNALEDRYEKSVVRFLDEYEWYARALKAARQRESCDRESPEQQQMCRG
jgi:NAD(P)H-dependent FMN reductase